MVTRWNLGAVNKKYDNQLDQTRQLQLEAAQGERALADVEKDLLNLNAEQVS